MLLSLAALVVACGGSSTGQENEGADCVALCEKGKAEQCRGSAGLNCDDNCFSEDARAETSGCRGTYNGTLTCWDGLEDVCTVASSCRNELSAHLACIAEYCSENPADFCP